MRRARPGFRAAPAAAWLALFLAAGAAGSGAPARSTTVVDGAALYNAGTDALERGDLGPAVAFLRAAQRIDPRADDIRHNLAEARTRAAAGRGSTEASPPLPAGTLFLSSPEAWWLAAALLSLGAVLALGGTFVGGRDGAPGARRPRALTVTSAVLMVLGVSLAGILAARARTEATYPEGVVVVPVLEVGPPPEERPRPPYLLGAGEEVRIGRGHGTLVEIRAGGAVIGWASRSGVWRVADAPRYTARLP